MNDRPPAADTPNEENWACEADEASVATMAKMKMVFMAMDGLKGLGYRCIIAFGCVHLLF